MPRRSRIDAVGALHHIIARGIQKGRIFPDDSDRNNCLERFGDIGEGTEPGEGAKPSMLLGSRGSWAKHGCAFQEAQAFPIRGKSVGKARRNIGPEKEL